MHSMELVQPALLLSVMKDGSSSKKRFDDGGVSEGTMDRPARLNWFSLTMPRASLSKCMLRAFTQGPLIALSEIVEGTAHSLFL